jgi:hypothetical protein
MVSAEIQYDLPASRDALLASLVQVNERVTALWARIDADTFFALPPGEGWSVAGNLSHLVNATNPVAKAMRLPKIVLRLLFGTRAAGSRSFVEMRDTYQKALREGGSAGKFAPQRRPPPADPVAAREALLQKWQNVVPNLTAAVHRWDEAALDRYQLPHPLLGKLTVREMLYFTLYHLGHHAEIVAARHP